MLHTLARIWVLIVGFSLSACVPITDDLRVNGSYEMAWVHSEYAPYARDIFGFGGGGGHVYFDYGHGYTYHIRDHHGRILAHAVRRPGGHYLIVNDHDRILFHLLFAGGGLYRIEDPLGYHYGFLDYYDTGHFALLDRRHHSLSTVWFQPLYFAAPHRRPHHHRHNPKHQIRDAQPMATAPPATMHHPGQQKRHIEDDKRDKPTVRYHVKPHGSRHIKQPKRPQRKFAPRPSRDHPHSLHAIKQLHSHDAAKVKPKKAAANPDLEQTRPGQKPGKDAQSIATAPPATMRHPGRQQRHIEDDRRDKPTVRYHVKPHGSRHIKQPRRPQQKLAPQPSRDHPAHSLRAIKQLRSHDAAKSKPKKSDKPRQLLRYKRDQQKNQKRH